MRLKKNILSIIFSAGLLFGCAENMADFQKKTGAKPMTGAELKARYSKIETNSWTAANGNSGTGIINPNGTASVDWGSGGDTGTWHIKGDTVCHKWTTIRDGKEYCLTTFKVGDKKYRNFKSDGSLSSTTQAN